MPSPRPLPTQTKKVRGTLHPERQKNEPSPSVKLPVAPEWLSERANEIFEMMTLRLGGMRLASESHTEMLSLLAMQLERVERLSRFLQQNGTTYETSSREGSVRVISRPEVRELQDAAKHTHMLLTEFGLSPSSQSKINLPPSGGEENPFEEFFVN